jgi:predicted transcriptional regulator/Zn-dependent protease with chaperone function
MPLPHRSRPFGDLEATVMDLMWSADRPLLVREVIDLMRPERAPAYTTVMTVMDNLHRKGWLERRRDGRAWRYEPVLTRQAYTARLMHEALAVSDDRAGVLARFVAEIDPADAAALAAAWSVPVALVLAGMTIILPPSAVFADVGRLVGACLIRLRAAYGTPAGAGIVTAGQVLSIATLGRMAWAIGRVGHRRRTERRRHRLLIRLAGGRRPDVPAVVLDCPGPAAYSVAGRRPEVVVTSGAVDLLTGPQLGAVLAHERAHLRRRHHRWALAAALVAEVMPVVPLLREAPARVGRLLEMDADEHAADHHEPRVLASALVTVTSAGGHTAAVPGGATPIVGRPRGAGATGAGAEALARVHRILRPPDRLPRRRAAITRAAVVALTVAPLVLATAPAVVALLP